MAEPSEEQTRAHPAASSNGQGQAQAQKTDKPGWRLAFSIEQKCLGDWKSFCQLMIVLVVVSLLVILLVSAWPWPTGVASGLGAVGLAVRKTRANRIT